MRPHLLFGAALLLCLSAGAASAQNDITVLTQRVLFNNPNGDEQTAILRVNFDPRVPDGTRFSVYVRPNEPQPPAGGVQHACPVFEFPSPGMPQVFTVTKPAPHRIMLRLKSNSTVSKQQQNCALTYSIVPLGQPANYFGFPEIGIAYRLR
jgi:hypothetical protein